MPVKTERDGRVLYVTLDRPEARNAFDKDTIRTLKELFEGLAVLEPWDVDLDRIDTAAADVLPGVVVLRSTGPVFCSGADLGDMERLGRAGFQENLEAALEMGGMFRAIRLCPAPVVAQVQGPAYGGGVGMVCACDVVVAGAEARFAFSEVRLGLVAGVIAPLVIDRIGQAAARHYFLTGDPIRSVDALRIGLIDRLAAQDGLDAAVAGAVRSLLLGGPAALGRIKSLIEGTVSLGFDRSLEFTARAIAEARTSKEAQAALAAFFRKERAPWARDTGKSGKSERDS